MRKELNEYSKDYLKNRTRMIEASKIRYKNLRKIFNEWRSFLKCSRCSETDSVCLDFHHCDPSQKEVNLIQMVTRGYKSVMKELNKCIVVCTNCHRKIHAYDIKVEPDENLSKQFEKFHQTKL